MIGVVLLILTMTMAFTGYLLPFDQRSFWASVVGININGTGPIVGPYLSDFLRAGPELGATTLSRFYAIHMLLVPGAIIALIGAHLYLVVKLGTTAPPWLRAEKPKVAAPGRPSSTPARTGGGNGAAPAAMKPADKQAYLEEYELLKKKGKPFFPYAVLKDSAMALIVVGVIIAMSIMLGAEQGPKADPTTTTYVPRPEWYFFFLFELLRVIKPPELVPIATIGIPTICMVLLLLLPFYDRGPERRPERRPIATTAGLPDDRRDGLPHLPRRDRRLADRDRHGGRAAATRPARRSSPAPAASPATSSARTATTAPGPELTHIAAADPARGDHPLGRNRPGHHALLPRPAAEEARRSSPTSSPRSTERLRTPQADSQPVPGLGPVRRRRSTACSTGSPARYDVLNSVMTAGLHHRWRERAADRAELGPGDSALDVCCGTGDLALELAGRVAPGGSVVGCDFSEPMLDLAREKAAARGAAGVRFEWADALELPYDAGRFDAVTVGFGVRNLADLDRGLREMARVLRPGGRLVDPRDHPAAPPAALDLLLALVRPHRARCSAPLAGDREAYSYLPESVRSFPAPARPGGEDGRRRARADPLHGPRRRDHRDPQRRRAGDPPLRGPAAGHRGARRLEPLAAGPAGRGRGRCCASRPSATASCSARDATATLAAGGKRLRPLLVLLCAGPGGRRGGGAGRRRDRAGPHGDPGPRRRPRRRAAAPRAARRSPRPRAATAPIAAGDLLFSRAFALLAGAGDAPRGRAARRGLGRARPRRAGPAPGRLRHRDLRGALPGALPAEDRAPVRVRLPARAADDGSALRRLRRARSASPSSSSTTSSTSPARRSGPARRAAPTCSTAPSPCR